MKTLIIVPAYNEAKNILNVVQKINELKIDYIVINDASIDNTKDVIKQNNINALNLTSNVGIARVTQIGFKYALYKGYDSVVCIDGDGQHQPKYINKLLDGLDNNTDYVIGSRYLNQKKPKTMRMLGSSILSILIKIKTGVTIKDPTSGMRALGKKVLIDFSESLNHYAEPDALCYLIKKGYNVKEVDVRMSNREEGESYFRNPVKSLIYMISEIIMIIFVR